MDDPSLPVSTITNRVVGTQHQCTLKANRVDEDGDETGEAIIVTSIYCDGEWTVYPSLTGIVEGDSPVRPAGTEELVEYMAERVNDWDFADDVIEDEIIELTDDRRKTMRRALAQTANLPVTDLRTSSSSLPVRQAVTDDHQGLDYRSVWYSSQREHIAGWLDEYDGRGAYNRKNPRPAPKPSTAGSNAPQDCCGSPRHSVKTRTPAAGRSQLQTRRDRIRHPNVAHSARSSPGRASSNSSTPGWPNRLNFLQRGRFTSYNRTFW